MSNRRFSPNAFQIALRADRSVAKPLSLNWAIVHDDARGVSQHRCHRDGKLVGYASFDNGRCEAVVFVPGIEPSVRTVGSFAMSPMGLRAAKVAIEAVTGPAVVAALTEAA